MHYIDRGVYYDLYGMHAVESSAFSATAVNYDLKLLMVFTSLGQSFHLCSLGSLLRTRVDIFTSYLKA
jgi:hypothetical protein